MCIRDRCGLAGLAALRDEAAVPPLLAAMRDNAFVDDRYRCLLYTSDAADERSSVDLGGRRIIKKKKGKRERRMRYIAVTAL